MEVPFVNEDFPTSGVMDDGVIITHHQEYICAYYQYECGKSFLDICLEMGLDSTDTHISF